jgi:glycosyltransferase involved in cell wall biosynthesis
MSRAPGAVWLDARGTQSALHGERGIARYVAGHTRALVSIFPELIGAIGLDPKASIPPSLEPLAGSGLFAWHRRNRPPRAGVPDIYHVMSPFEMTMAFDDVWPPWLRQSDARLVVTLHDLIPLILYEDYVKAWGSYGTVWMARLGMIRAADHVVTNSENTARDAIERLGIPEERVTAIHSGVSGDLASLVGSREGADRILRTTLPKIRPGFLLYVGGDDKRKNLDGILRAYAQLPGRLRAAHQLVIAFRVGPLRKFELRVMARSLGIGAGDLVLTGFVTDRQLAALYRACELFVFPSLYEGAGLPVLEAMSCGAPVAASNTTSIPELLGDPGGTFDPADPADIARSVTEVVETPGRLDELRERSRRRVALHTWERVARETIHAYERTMEAPSHRQRTSPRPGRKRLAVATPWSGDSSPTARYSRALVSALAERAEVEVVVQAGGADRAARNGRARMIPEGEFDWRRGLRGYDRCLYVIGGSADHLHALEALSNGPGTVLAHDVHLLPLYAEMHKLRQPFNPYWLEDKLIEMYGARIPRADLLRVPYDRPERHRALYMTREIQANAERVLVHSRSQAEILRLERPDDGAPIEIVPRAIPAEPSASFARPAGDAPLVVHSDAAEPGGWSAVSDAIAGRIPVIAVGADWSEDFPEPVVLAMPGDATAAQVAERIEAVIRDDALRARVREAQDAYAAERSFARVAGRYAELLDL